MTSPASIGEIKFSPKSFPGVDTLLEFFKQDSFKNRSSIDRNEVVNRKLLDFIESAPKNSFLLVEVINYLEAITKFDILDGTYNLTAFERWLNQLSGLNYEDNRRIRGKIVGLYVPRDEFCGIFPVSQNKVHPGTHTVTAHTPPDLDSLTGSFIGWLDAFACRVGSTLTVWNVPLGMPGPVASRLFIELYGEPIFERIAKNKTLISHVAMDIVTQERLITAKGDINIRHLNHDRHRNHIIYVDENGFFLGDWRVSDVDAVAQVQRLLNMCMHAYEKEVVHSITKLFSDPHFNRTACNALLRNLLNKTVPEFSMQAYRLSEVQTQQLDIYLNKVLGVSNGYRSSIDQFFARVDQLTNSTFYLYGQELRKLSDPDFYDNDQRADFSCEEIFSIFHKAYDLLMENTKILRNYLDRLDVAMAIKNEILGYKPTMVSTKAEINEIHSKIKDYRHITVVFTDKSGRRVPVGVIHYDDLENPIQGTISFRDFCNYDEIKLQDYLEVVSAIDHHRTTLSTQKAMVLSVADVQSSNVITAEKAFEINDRFSTRGQTVESIQAQLEEIHAKKEHSGCDLRILEKLYKKKRALINSRQGEFFVNPDREMQEYLLCLNAIIDDTDLLNKCGWRDLLAIAELLNRIKSLQLGIEVELLDFSEIPKDRRELKRCIREVLENKELYSFYKVVYDHRESVVNQLILSVEPTSDSRFFEDRKIQNQACLISQFKLFPRNWETFRKHRSTVLLNWMYLSRQARRKDSGVDFFLHMLSTIPGAQEAYHNISVNVDQDDEFWLSGMPDADESVSRMRQFFISMRKSPNHQNINLRCQIEGQNGRHKQIFESILKDTLGQSEFPFIENPDLPYPVIVFRFNQGTLNSRKAHITPLLPK
jgi:hypothetical protein